MHANFVTVAVSRVVVLAQRLEMSRAMNPPPPLGAYVCLLLRIKFLTSWGPAGYVYIYIFIYIEFMGFSLYRMFPLLRIYIYRERERGERERESFLSA